MPAVQKAAQQALAGTTGAIVALDPTTGALIAVRLGAVLRSADARGRLGARSARIPARRCSTAPTQGLYPPGSSFKVVTADGRARHRRGHARRRRSIDTGTYVVYGGKVTNYGGEVFGANTFTAGADLLDQHDLRQGRQQAAAASASIDVHAAASASRRAAAGAARGRGRAPAAATARRACCRRTRFMDPLQVAWAAVGQEQVLATPLQMALVAAGVANGGQRHGRRTIVQEVVVGVAATWCEQAQPKPWTTAMTPATAASSTA